MSSIYGEGKVAALKRLEMHVEGFSKNSSELKIPEGTIDLSQFD